MCLLTYFIIFLALVPSGVPNNRVGVGGIIGSGGGGAGAGEGAGVCAEGDAREGGGGGGSASEFLFILCLSNASDTLKV